MRRGSRALVVLAGLAYACAAGCRKGVGSDGVPADGGDSSGSVAPARTAEIDPARTKSYQLEVCRFGLLAMRLWIAAHAPGAGNASPGVGRFAPPDADAQVDPSRYAGTCRTASRLAGPPVRAVDESLAAVVPVASSLARDLDEEIERRTARAPIGGSAAADPGRRDRIATGAARLAPLAPRLAEAIEAWRAERPPALFDESEREVDAAYEAARAFVLDVAERGVAPADGGRRIGSLRSSAAALSARAAAGSDDPWTAAVAGVFGDFVREAERAAPDGGSVAPGAAARVVVSFVTIVEARHRALATATARRAGR